MHGQNRRSLLRNSAAITTGFLSTRLAHGGPQSDKINIAFIGPGGMGSGHVRTFCQRPDVTLSWVCDADRKRAESAAKTIKDATGQIAKTTTDMRYIFDSKEVQAVVIATPDHWHAPASIMAANAGKHVYVEKPCSHNLREGRWMIQAARKRDVIMQVGTQSRSTANIIDVINKLRSGVIGEILTAKAWNSQLRANHGRKPTIDPPPDLDYEMWLGPVPHVPFKATYHPAHWRWFYHFGSGDIGNDGIHDIDIARWGLGVDQHPNRIIAHGSKLFFDDDQEWPDTIYCSFEYDLASGKRKQLVYEQRDWSPYVQEGQENGCAWYGTQGMVVGGKVNGWRIYGRKNKLLEELPSPGGPDLAAHHADFLDAIRNHRKPNADIEINHLSTSLCHLANIALRNRKALEFDPVSETLIGSSSDFNNMLHRSYREHWATPNRVS